MSNAARGLIPASLLRALAPGADGRRTPTQLLLIGAGVAAGVSVAAYVVKVVFLAPGDGRRYLDDDQGEFVDAFDVATGRGAIKVQRVPTGDVAPAAATLGDYNASTNPMLRAAAREVRPTPHPHSRGAHAALPYAQLPPLSALSQILDDAARATACRWLYDVMLRSTVPTSYGAIPLQSQDANAVAVWFPKGAYDAASSGLALP